MSDIAETYIVVSLLMAVFAAVAAMGTALVLGVGFERLRGGFEVIRKQTAFFSDAIRQLDERAATLDDRADKLDHKVLVLDHKVAGLEEQQNELVRELRENAANHIHAPRDDAALSRSAAMLTEVTGLAQRMQARQARIKERIQSANSNAFVVPTSMMQHVLVSAGGDGIRFH